MEANESGGRIRRSGEFVDPIDETVELLKIDSETL